MVYLKRSCVNREYQPVLPKTISAKGKNRTVFQLFVGFALRKRVVRVAGITAALCFYASAGGIDRIDIFDNAENHLLFVTFEYDSAGNNTGRTVYASDSTFLRATQFTKDQSGNVTAENSVDYESNPLFTTRIIPQSSKTNFSIKDQFDMDFLGAQTSFEKNEAGEFAISQGGATLYKQKYEFASDGRLMRIDYTDPSGTLLYYATVTGSIGTIHGAAHDLHTQFAPVIRTAAGGKLLASFTLTVPSNVTVELFTPAGRLAEKTIGRSLAAGRRTLIVGCDKMFGAGTYIARISINDSPIFNGRLLVVR
jgi:hypothetical protein